MLAWCLQDISAFDGSIPPNCLLASSIENQAHADECRDVMHQIAALGWYTMVSYEPALGPIDWIGWEFLVGMICGGESGPGARPMHPHWARSTHDWCLILGIPFFFKQWGEWGQVEGQLQWKVGKKYSGRLLDGKEFNDWPGAA
jgi:protein gp37